MATQSDPLTPEFGPSTRKPRRALRAILLTAAGILVLMLAISIYLTPLNHEPNTTPRVKSTSNLRQIGQAILLYCNDHGGVYPDSFQTILLEGDITSEVFVSPMGSDTPAAGPTLQATADDLDAGGHLSYVYLGRGLTTQTATATTIVAYEKLSIAGNGANVLYGDGHAEFDDAKFVTQIIDKSASGEFPTIMPSGSN